MHICMVITTEKICHVMVHEIDLSDSYYISQLPLIVTESVGAKVPSLKSGIIHDFQCIRGK